MCVKHGQSCCYDESRTRLQGPGVNRTTTKAAGLRARIALLEDLVRHSQGHDSSTNTASLPVITNGPVTSPQNQQPVTTTVLNLSSPNTAATSSEQEYVSPAHWTALEQELRSLKEELGPDASRAELWTAATPMDTALSNMIIPGSPMAHSSRDDILAAFPPRSTSDKLVNTYFNTTDDPYLRE